MRLLGVGAFTFRVGFTREDARLFASRWPCSTVKGPGSFTFERGTGDLVAHTGAPEFPQAGDGWSEFASDCLAYGRKRLAVREAG